MAHTCSFAVKSLLLIASAIAIRQYPSASQPPPSDLKKGWDSISTRQAQEILTFLANECEGRGSTQPGFQKAAKYVAAKFKSWGLKPMGDRGTYFQNVPFVVTHVNDKGCSIEVAGSKESIAAGPEFRFTSISASLSVASNLAIIKPSSNRLVLGDVDLRGRIVLLYGDRADLDLRDAISIKKPAAILYVVQRLPIENYGATRVTGGDAAVALAKTAARVPIGTISEKAADGLVAALPDPSSSSAPITLKNGAVQLKAEVDSREIEVPNVVALLPGSDPELKREIVGVGAHLDHLGKFGKVVYPGADDDGSGTTAVLSIAHAMATNPKKPKRSILFMTFCGEELGLIGSSWFVNHPVTPLNEMVAELQMDMVARDSYGPQNGDQRRMDVEKENVDTIRLVGSKRISTELDNAIQNSNKYVGFNFKYDAEDVYTRSDHYNFASHGIPIAFLFDGFTPDYHQPTDTVDKIDWVKLTNTAKLFYLAAYSIADNPHAPAHDVGAGAM